MHHDDKRALSTEEIDEKLEEGVNCEGLRIFNFSVVSTDVRALFTS